MLLKVIYLPFLNEFYRFNILLNKRCLSNGKGNILCLFHTCQDITIILKLFLNTKRFKLIYYKFNVNIQK